MAQPKPPKLLVFVLFKSIFLVLIKREDVVDKKKNDAEKKDAQLKPKETNH